MLRRILVVDLLGGLGDLVMVLPVVHALARRHPYAALRVLTHAPGDTLLRHDPTVAGATRARAGEERAAVVRELERFRPDLVVSTTRYDGIAEEIEARAPQCVTNLWRDPPPDEPVTARYLRILAAEGVIGDELFAPRIWLTGAERAEGARILEAHTPPGPPVVLVPSAGMAVKHWPHWRVLAEALACHRPPLVAGEPPVLQDWRDGPAHPLPALDLRGLAGVLAAVAARRGVVVGPDTGPMRIAAAVGARTVAIFGPTSAARYGLGPPGVDLQGLPTCPHRRPTAITEQVCWWEADCPLSTAGPACMADATCERVLAAVEELLALAPATNFGGHTQKGTVMPQPEGAELEAVRRRRAELRQKYLRPADQRPTSAVRGVHHIALICKDVEETVRFYQEILGFPLVELVENRDYAGSSHFFFDVGNRNLLGFFDFPGHDHPPFQETIGGVQHIALATTPEGFAAARKRLDENGIEYLGPDRGVRNSLYIRDPNGVGIEFYEQELGVFEGERLVRG